jgi:hypothetical protein
MVQPDLIRNPASADVSNPAIQAIVRHLCEGECHAFGDVLEWCESRGDCSFAVVCPTCNTQFLIEEDDLVDLRQWTASRGTELACGVHWD